MAVFALLFPAPQPRIVEAIRREVPQDHYSITDTQWLVSWPGTPMELSARLGIFDVKNPSAVSTGNAIIIAVGSYYGRAPTAVWDWMKSKMEPKTLG